MGIFGKSRLRLILDHHEEVEDLLQRIDEQAEIISNLSSEVADLIDQANHSRARADAALDYATMLRTGVIALAQSWHRLGHAGNYGMAAAELLGYAEQLVGPGEPEQPHLTAVPSGGGE